MAIRDRLRAIRNGLRQQRVTLHGDVGSVVRIGAEAHTGFSVDPVWDAVTKLYETGLHPAIALCIRHRGQVVLDRTIGHVDNPPGATTPGEVATPNTLFCLFSASKILTAMVIHTLIDDGLLELDAPAAHYFPEFARHGKGDICIRHLLNHTAGISHMPADVDRDTLVETGRLSIEQLADLVPTSPPGHRVAYHPLTSWLILTEIVQRVTGSDLRQLLEARFLVPLGFAHLTYGVGEADIPRVAKHARTGLPIPRAIGRIFERTLGIDPSLLDFTNGPPFLTGLHPSANIIGTAAEACRFMQMLLDGGELDGVRVVKEETIRRAVGDVTPTRLDGTFGFPIRYGLGTMAGGCISFFGLGTREVYGHLGFSSVVLYADPSRELSVAFLNSGKPMLAPGMLRWAWCLQKILSAADSSGHSARAVHTSPSPRASAR